MGTLLVGQNDLPLVVFRGVLHGKSRVKDS
jgi:hypothetical protein